MVEKEKQKIDWIYLPTGVEEVSLYNCLHDGKLISCKSDLAERSVKLEFYVRHLLEGEEEEDKVRFLLNIENVTSVRAIAHFPPIEKCDETQGVSEEERRRVLDEYYGKWREESYAWQEFEAVLSTDPLLIYDPGFVSNGRETTLRLSGSLNGERYNNIFFDVFIRGENLSAMRTDAQDFSLDDFIQLGTDYWDNFSKRRRGE